MMQKMGLEPKINAATQGLLPKNLKQWIIDNGATDHVSGLPLAQATINPPLPPVVLPNGNRVPINSVGNYHFSPKISLYNVLGIASFLVNLISVSRLTQSL